MVAELVAELESKILARTGLIFRKTLFVLGAGLTGVMVRIYVRVATV